MTTEPLPRPLSRQQERIIGAIAAHLDQHGYPPSVREIGVACGLRSSSTVWYHLHQLAGAGWLSWEPGRARSIRLSWQVPTQRARDVVLATLERWTNRQSCEEVPASVADEIVGALTEAGLLR